MKKTLLLAALIASSAAPLAAQSQEPFKSLFDSWANQPNSVSPVEDDRTKQSAVKTRKRGKTFADYDPCDTSNPDYGGQDFIACDIEKGRAGRIWRYGTQDAYDQIYIARMAREARRQMRQLGY